MPRQRLVPRLLPDLPENLVAQAVRKDQEW